VEHDQNYPTFDLRLLPLPVIAPLIVPINCPMACGLLVEGFRVKPGMVMQTSAKKTRVVRD